MEYREVQAIAKETMKYIRAAIRPGMRLAEVRALCEERMLYLGADSFWYWNVGAFVFAGEETNLSVSGRNYEAGGRTVAENDIVTIDLSPQCGDTWGDYARTIILEEGRVVEHIEEIKRDEWREGLEMEEKLHEELIRFARPDTTFEELYYHMNAFIAESGFVNLDFAGNLGHSIARRKEDRIYIEMGNHARLGEAELFTFEPHIGRSGSAYGYKKENIYLFEGSAIREL